MEKNFIYSVNGKLVKGLIKNIPDKTNEQEIKNRIEIVCDFYNDEIIKAIPIIDFTEQNWTLSELDVEIDWLMKDDEQPNLDLIAVQTIIEDAESQGLTAEVVYYALKYMKGNPKSSIEKAINVGYEEFLK